MENREESVWWKESVIYQIYPRSFKDSNGDGIGDINGIISQLDYLQELGVDIIWLSPVYESPNDDNGYDISDYCAIHPDFGTMEDFDRLLQGMKNRGLKLVMDLVVNHSSDEHAWFKEARKSKDNPYRDFYIWRPGKNGGPPNDWVSFFSGSAWQYDELTEEYYLHYFTKKQPDLNWENEKLRQEVYKIMHFWLQKGVDGFRMDVIPLISKDTSFPDFPADFDGYYPYIYANGPRIHEFLQEMHREVLSKYDVMTVGEGIGIPRHLGIDYVGASRKELNMIFHFDHMFIDREKDDFYKKREWTLPEFKAIFAAWEENLQPDGWNSIFLGNHDFPRIVSRFGNDGSHRELSAKALATLLLSMRGTPYIYQGDEIGMTNVAFPSITDYNDVQTLNAYREVAAKGGDTAAFLKAQHYFSRDNARTPIQWNAGLHAGFTSGTPWLKLNPNYPEINVAAAKNAPDSIWHYYRAMLKTRKQNLTLVYGQYLDEDPQHLNVFIFSRRLADETYITIANMSQEVIDYSLPQSLAGNVWDRVIGNYKTTKILGDTFTLQPWEASIFRLKK